MMGPTTVAVISALLAPGALALAHVNAPADGYAGHTAPSAHVAITSLSDVPTRGRVLGIAVAPASAGADIVLAIDSSVTLKHFTSYLIGRFCSTAQVATQVAFGPGPHTRYGADLVVPDEVRMARFTDATALAAMGAGGGYGSTVRVFTSLRLDAESFVAQLTPQLPRIAGQHAQYTENQLKAFNKRERTNDNAVMHTVASKLTELEAHAVAEYIATLE